MELARVPVHITRDKAKISNGFSRLRMVFLNPIEDQFRIGNRIHVVRFASISPAIPIFQKMKHTHVAIVARKSAADQSMRNSYSSHPFRIDRVHTESNS